MKVPYAKKWQKETDKLRNIVLYCDLTEELKWGKPCFTYQKKHIAIVIPLKDACALSFFKGALLKDPKHILQKIGEHTQAGRWIKFTSAKEISALRRTQLHLRSDPGRGVGKEGSPKEGFGVCGSRGVAELKAAFKALAPGRRKSYIYHVSGAKQAKTRAARAEKCVPMILSGRGFNEPSATWHFAPNPNPWSDPPSEGIMGHKLIRATELAEFVHCSRAWELKYLRAVEPSREAQQL